VASALRIYHGITGPAESGIMAKLGLAQSPRVALQASANLNRDHTEMRFIVALLAVLWLGACSSMPSSSEQGFVDQVGWQHQQAILDADAILQGMNQARAQTEAFAKQSQ